MDTLGRPAWAELADQLVDMIVSGELKPGQRLVEADIADRFGVSRGPVRTAFSRLERGGLVDLLPKRGMVVVEMTAHDVIEVYEVRVALEMVAIRAVATRARDLNLGSLETYVNQLVTASNDGDRAQAIQADLAFHRELCQLSTNQRLVRAWESLSNQIRLVIGTLQGEGYDKISPLLLDHQQIYRALLSDDPDVAVDLLRRHLLGTRDAMVSATERAHQGLTGDAAPGDSFLARRRETTERDADAEPTTDLESSRRGS